MYFLAISLFMSRAPRDPDLFMATFLNLIHCYVKKTHEKGPQNDPCGQERLTFLLSRQSLSEPMH